MNYNQKKVIYWRRILLQYVSSGLKPGEFCHQHNLSIKNFYKWRIRLSDQLPEAHRRDVSGLTLVPVAPPPVHAAAVEEAVTVMRDSGVSVEAGGLRVHLTSGFDAETFRRVLKELGGVPC